MRPDDSEDAVPLVDDSVRELLARPQWEVDAPEFLEQTPLPEVVEEPPAPAPAPTPVAPKKPAEPPPPLTRIVEAMLFVGGEPLTAEQACAVLPGVTADDFREAIDALNRGYRDQGRPYAVQLHDKGYLLVLRPRFAVVRDRLFGAVREARLSAPAVEVLSLVAYRQPVTRQDVDTARGGDSAALLRQLVRHGLVALQRGDEGQDATYVTTGRFLELFRLRSLDELPQTQDLQRL